MPCCAVLLALVSPRLAIAFVAIFSTWLTQAFDGSWVVPLLGFLFLPWTTLGYTLLYFTGTDQVAGIEWFFVAFFFFIDLGSYAGSSRGRRD